MNDVLQVPEGVEREQVIVSTPDLDGLLDMGIYIKAIDYYDYEEPIITEECEGKVIYHQILV